MIDLYPNATYYFIYYELNNTLTDLLLPNSFQ